MSVDRESVIELLQKTHLFRSLTEEEIVQVAEQFEPIFLEDGQMIFRQGAAANSFYIIFDGRVDMRHGHDKTETRISSLVTGDYFGEEGLIRGGKRSVSAFANGNTIVLRLKGPQFHWLLQNFPDIRPNFEVAIHTHHLVQRVRLDWLGKDEVVYMMVRKHQMFLFLRLIFPVLATIAGGALFLSLYLGNMESIFLLSCTGILWVLAIFWIAWSILDWSNDYYIVTNQRVAWMEKIALLYDSRQEAPLYTILSVGVQTDQVGRIFNYGDVNVRTFTGTIILRRVEHPRQIASLVEEQWSRARVTSRKEEAAAMNRAIRERLGLGDTVQVKTPGTKIKPVEVKPGLLQSWFANFFRIRFEEGNVVTYRKHWFILIQRTAVPGFLVLAFLTLFILRLFNVFTWLSVPATITTCAVFGLGCLLWYLYEYVDWRNDIYRVTPDQIMDIERKPLGTEEKRTAPLESILSIEYERIGLLGLILNFGTVYIVVGNTKFTFDYVYNPSQVQQDIFRRMDQRVTRKREAEAQAERDRVSEWFAVYHENEDEIRRLENQKKHGETRDFKGFSG